MSKTEELYDIPKIVDETELIENSETAVRSKEQRIIYYKTNKIMRKSKAVFKKVYLFEKKQATCYYMVLLSSPNTPRYKTTNISNQTFCCC